MLLHNSFYNNELSLFASPALAPYKTQLNINGLELKESHPSGGFFVPEIILRFCFAINFRY